MTIKINTKEEFILIYVTFPSLDEAKKLIKSLLEQKLIACANIIPQITSLYWWQGDMQEEQEWISIMKTRKNFFPQVKDFIENHHSYQCPCVLSLNVDQGHEKYLKWLEECTQT